MLTVGIDKNQEVIFFSKGISVEEREGIYTYEISQMPRFEKEKKLFFDPESGEFYTKDYTEKEKKAMKDALERYRAKEEARERKTNALIWLAENDWKINKHILGEWSDTDERWIEYVETRAQKRAEIDEADKILNE